MSNRAERRAQRRKLEQQVALKNALPDGVAIDAKVLTKTGEIQHVTSYRTLPNKRAGVHRWVAFVGYYFADEQADAFTSGGGPVMFDGSNIISPPALGCIDCEGAYAEAKGTPCPAGDEWRDGR